MGLSALTTWLTASPLRIALAVASVALLAFITYSSLEARYVRITRDEITSERVPAEFDGVRIVFLADIHAGRFMGPRGMAALVDKVNALDPDVLVLGGDYVGGQANGPETFYAQAPRFEAALGKFAVMGNHDAWEGATRARDGLEASGFELLQNSSAMVRKGDVEIAVAGVEDLDTGSPDAGAAAAGIPADVFALLVSHNPDVFATQLDGPGRTWDLALAGHTHAGQLTALGMMAPIVPSAYGQRYRAGWVREEGTPILVTHGVGVVTLPLRFFAHPEIHEITLRRP